MQNIDTFDLVGGIWMCLPMMYFFLGLFSDARWLQPNWERKSGRWVVIPTPRLVRVLYVLAFGLLAAEPFEKAFHYDSGRMVFVRDLLVAIILGLLIFVGKREERQNHDPAA
jgi:hypothetical protein